MLCPATCRTLRRLGHSAGRLSSHFFVVPRRVGQDCLILLGRHSLQPANECDHVPDELITMRPAPCRHGRELHAMLDDPELLGRAEVIALGQLRGCFAVPTGWAGRVPAARRCARRSPRIRGGERRYRQEELTLQSAPVKPQRCGLWLTAQAWSYCETDTVFLSFLLVCSPA